MTQPALSYFRKRRIASVIQAVAGTPETVTPATHGWRIFNGRSGIEIDAVEDNPDSNFFEGPDFAPANERGFIEGEARLVSPVQPGHATDGVPEVDVALRTGGLARTLNAASRLTDYTPVSDEFEIATHQWEQAGLYKQLADARTMLGDIVLEIGQRAKITGLRLQGDVSEFNDTDDLDDIVTSDAVGPVMRADNSRTTIVIDGGSPLVLWNKLHGLQLNAQMQTEEYTSHKETGFSDRTPQWRIRIAKTDLGDLNPRTVRQEGSIVEVTTLVWGTDGRYVELYTRGKLREMPEEDIDGKMGFALSGPTRVGPDGIDFRLRFGDRTFHINGVVADAPEDVVYDDGAGLSLSGEYTGPVTWAISAGALPTGLAINAATGAITGTPTAAATYNFTVTATDSTVGTPKVATQAFEVEITA